MGSDGRIPQDRTYKLLVASDTSCSLPLVSLPTECLYNTDISAAPFSTFIQHPCINYSKLEKFDKIQKYDEN